MYEQRHKEAEQGDEGSYQRDVRQSFASHSYSFGKRGISIIIPFISMVSSCVSGSVLKQPFELLARALGVEVMAYHKYSKVREVL